MKEFRIYQEISHGRGTEMEIVVLTGRTLRDGQVVKRSVNRHVHFEGDKWIGRHPDFYDGVDDKNTRAEESFAQLESDLAYGISECDQLDEELDTFTNQKKFDAMVLSVAVIAESEFEMKPDSVRWLLNSVRPFVVEKVKAKRVKAMKNALDIEVDLKRAKNHLADVQRDFPRLVAYI